MDLTICENSPPDDIVRDVDAPQDSTITKETALDPPQAENTDNTPATTATVVDHAKGLDGKPPIRLRPLPGVPFDMINRNISMEDFNVEVTSLDIAAHGCFVAAGCSNGMVLLFDLSDDSEPCGGRIIGHIHAKGLHTNLILTVQFSDDCRFLFAGVLKGSSELLAIDIGKLYVNTDKSASTSSELFKQQQQQKMFSTPSLKKVKHIRGSGSEKSKRRYLETRRMKNIQVHSHSDPKLRGFAAVTRVCCTASNKIPTAAQYGEEPEYRLACGKGIKNVHVWQFMPGERASGARNISSSSRGGSAQKVNAATINSSVEKEKGSSRAAAVISYSAAILDNDNDNDNEEESVQLRVRASTTTGIESKGVDSNSGKTMLSPTGPNSNSNNNEMPAIGARWVCMYDVASNGNTITHISFRKGGMEMLSKSNGMNLRVWNLSNYKPANEDGSGGAQKPSYEDVPNSADVRCLLSSGFAYGGTYEFAVLRVDAPKEANRDALELPERTGGDDGAGESAAGLRRRRTMREIDDVIGSDDGAHVLVMCMDGGVMYHRGQQDTNASSSSSSSSSSATVSSKGLIELPALQRDRDLDQVMLVRRVGRKGHVVVLRAGRSGVTANGMGSGGGTGLESGNATPGSTGSGSAVSIPGFLAPQLNPMTSIISIQLLDAVSSEISSTAFYEESTGYEAGLPSDDSTAALIDGGWGSSGGGGSYYYHDSDSGGKSDDESASDSDGGINADGFNRIVTDENTTEGSSQRKKKNSGGGVVGAQSPTTDCANAPVEQPQQPLIAYGHNNSIGTVGSSGKRKVPSSSAVPLPKSSGDKGAPHSSSSGNKRRKVATFEEDPVSGYHHDDDPAQQVARLASARSSPVAAGIASGSGSGSSSSRKQDKEKRKIESSESNSTSCRSRKQGQQQQQPWSASKPLSRGLFPRGGGKDEGEEEEEEGQGQGHIDGSRTATVSGSSAKRGSLRRSEAITEHNGSGGLLRAPAAAPIVLGPAPQVRRVAIVPHDPLAAVCTSDGKTRAMKETTQNKEDHCVLSRGVLPLCEQFICSFIQHLSEPMTAAPAVSTTTSNSSTSAGTMSVGGGTGASLDMCTNIQLSSVILPVSTYCHCHSDDHDDESEMQNYLPLLGSVASTNLSVICLEQDRLRAMFVADLVKQLKAQIEASMTFFQRNISHFYQKQQSSNLFSAWLSFHRAFARRDNTVVDVLLQYEELAADMLVRQQIELEGSIATDLINFLHKQREEEASKRKTTFERLVNQDAVLLFGSKNEQSYNSTCTVSKAPRLQYRHGALHEWVNAHLQSELLTHLESSIPHVHV